MWSISRPLSVAPSKRITGNSWFLSQRNKTRAFFLQVICDWSWFMQSYHSDSSTFTNITSCCYQSYRNPRYLCTSDFQKCMDTQTLYGLLSRRYMKLKWTFCLKKPGFSNVCSEHQELLVKRLKFSGEIELL